MYRSEFELKYEWLKKLVGHIWFWYFQPHIQMSIALLTKNEIVPVKWYHGDISISADFKPIWHCRQYIFISQACRPKYEVNDSRISQLCLLCAIYVILNKMLVRYILSSVWVRLSIFLLSTIQYMGAMCFQFTHFPCEDWENIHFVLLSSSNRKYELLSIV